VRQILVCCGGLLNRSGVKASASSILVTSAFGEIMMLTFDELWEILNKPKAVCQETFASMWWWMRPKTVQDGKIAQICVDGGALPSISEVRRKVKEGSLSWNGEKVTDPESLVKFIWPGWGIIRIGKKQHFMVIKQIQE
jgi:tyrosyl-tRNA synthetase